MDNVIKFNEVKMPFKRIDLQLSFEFHLNDIIFPLKKVFGKMSLPL